jgi:hypothetical protein
LAYCLDENGIQSRSYLWETDVDTPPRAPIECFLEQGGASARYREESAVTLIKMIIITLVVILSILFFGRFLF